MRIKGWELSFFQSGEWQVCDERLRDAQKAAGKDINVFNPSRKNLFRSLSLIPLEEVRVCMVGQDPYPGPGFATGVAFSVPEEIHPDDYPVTLRTFLGEYRSDLGYALPRSGNLERWCERGVLLWNAIPSCRTGVSLSHDWPEWETLTREIVRKLSERGIVFALLGQVARRYIGDITTTNNSVVVTSHPSPRGVMNSKTPFSGSRLFSTINDKLVNNGQEMIDWKLP